MRSKDIYTGLKKSHFTVLYVLRNRETESLAALRRGSDMVLCLFATMADAEEYLYNWFSEPREWVVEVECRPDFVPGDGTQKLPAEWVEYSHVTINPPLVPEKGYVAQTMSVFRFNYQLDPQFYMRYVRDAPC